MSSARLGNRVPGAIAATVVALGLSYAVTAGLMPAAQPVAGGAPAPTGTAPGLALTDAPGLRARPALFRPAPAITAPVQATGTRPEATSAATPAAAAPSTSPMVPSSAAPAPSTTTAPQAPAQSTPAAEPVATPSAPAGSAKPKPKRTTTLSARPAKPSPPDFDDAASGGFDSSG